MCHSFYLAVISLLLFVASAAPAIAHDQEIEGGPEDAPASDQMPCIDGLSNAHPCFNMELVHFVPLAELGAISANDIWGWTDPLTGDEYAIIGLRDRTAFVHIDEFGHPTFLGMLMTRTFKSTWRDIKVYANHAFVVSEAAGHGMQVFDLTRLRDVDPTVAPVTFTSDRDYLVFGSAHNIAINEDSGFAYVVGSKTCAGGLHIIDIREPKNPLLAGCFSQDGYTHDAQCVTYHGPDADYAGHEVCFNSNEDTVTIVDVTVKIAPVMISRTPYTGAAYTHQGWLTEDHAYFLLDDELDEIRRRIGTHTIVWDMSDLDAPFVAGAHDSNSTAIDHNQYVKGNHVFQANYRSGIRILRLGDLSLAEMAEVAYFDTTPSDDLPIFAGTWSVYPYFESGYIIASDIHRGLYILWPDLDAVPECSDGIDNDGDGLRDYSEDPTCISEDAASESIRYDVELAVDPRSPSRPIVPNRFGNLRLAILGSDSVATEDLDIDSLLFEPNDVVPLIAARHIGGLRRDLDWDGFVDLPMRIPFRFANLEPAVQHVCVSGLLAGDAFEACVEIEVSECEASHFKWKRDLGFCRPAFPTWRFHHVKVPPDQHAPYHSKPFLR